MQWFETFLFCLAFCFLISGLDDLFIDLVHLFLRVKPERWTDEDWKAADHSRQQHIAVMIPAWNEFDVIEQMVRTNLRRIDYTHHRWFIGVYPNDQATVEAVSRLEKEFPERVTAVIADRPGPTSKAHCLNNIFREICRQADQSAWEPDLIALHDAEDVIHRDSFKVINSHPEEIEFFQIPIFSLHTPLSSLVSGTYMDEFAENHLKEIPARQKLGMPIPSAGVGTFVRFTAMLKAQRRFGYMFSEQSLTEDYDLSMRLAYINAKQKFVILRTRDQKQIVATLGYFPDRVKTSIRQKTRWIIGITLQSVSATPKNLICRYAKLRDRRGLLTNPINLLGWVGALNYIALFVFHQLPAFIHSVFLHQLFMANFMIFAVRVVQRFRFTYITYGLGHAAIGILRILLVNYINMMATFRAIYQFNRSKPNSPTRRRQIEWDKTDHRFPNAQELENNDLTMRGAF